METIHLTPTHPDYERFTALLRAEPLASQWWADAESEHECGVSYLMVVVDGVPAAWAGYRVAGGVLECCNNYVRQGYRDRSPELYAVAYAARHREVVTQFGLPAVTYLYAQPIDLHLADGWFYDIGSDGHGVSQASPDGEEHQWWRLRWPAPR